MKRHNEFNLLFGMTFLGTSIASFLSYLMETYIFSLTFLAMSIGYFLAYRTIKNRETKHESRTNK